MVLIIYKVLYIFDKPGIFTDECTAVFSLSFPALNSRRMRALDKIELSRYHLGELSALSHSDWWRESTFIPISSLRLKSYLTNPRAEENDLVLFMALDKSELVGFRTLLPDTMKSSQGKVKMAWLSGSWTHPAYRRQGISMRLFSMATEHWNGKLAVSNYAPATKKLLEKVNYSWNSFELKGRRYYHRFALASILPNRYPLLRHTSPILRGIDCFCNAFVDMLRNTQDLSEVQVEVKKSLKEEDAKFLNACQNHSLFARSVRKLNWIQTHPWISEQKRFKKEQKRYPFSLYTKQFQSFFCQFSNKEGSKLALIMLHLHNGFLSVPYIFMMEDVSESILTYLKSFQKTNHVDISTITEGTSLIDRRLGLVSKQFNRSFFFGPELKFKKGLNIQWGDGDAVFV